MVNVIYLSNFVNNLLFFETKYNTTILFTKSFFRIKMNRIFPFTRITCSE